MGDVILRTCGVSKRYRLGAAVNGRLTETLSDAFARTVARSRRGSEQSAKRTLWALRDVSLEVREGEVVGIIGRNGAGKSTLLKILSRITEPTEGYAELRGRVGSLLEVGSGFHPDLTGTENVYLYGAVLGMRRREVASKFDEIVAFADVERFLDTPVKRYSSGMYMRLAFSVAAHLEPEILIVDEVLAVGDVAFQKKCLGKMEDVATDGRTVLFVSHNLAAVSSLCERAYLLEQGRIALEGPAPEVVRSFLEGTRVSEGVPLAERADRGGDGSIRLTSLEIADADGAGVVSCGSRLRVTLRYTSEAPVRSPQFLVTIYDADWTGLFLLDSDAEGGLPDVLPAEGAVTCVSEPIDLTPGACRVNVAVSRAGFLADHVEYAGRFEVEADDYYSSGRLPAREWVLSLRRHRWEAGAC